MEGRNVGTIGGRSLWPLRASTTKYTYKAKFGFKEITKSGVALFLYKHYSWNIEKKIILYFATKVTTLFLYNFSYDWLYSQILETQFSWIYENISVYWDNLRVVLDPYVSERSKWKKWEKQKKLQGRTCCIEGFYR